MLTVVNTTFQGNLGILADVGLANFINDTLSNNNLLNRTTFDNVTGKITLTNTIIESVGGATTCRTTIVNGGGNIQFPNKDCGISVADPKLAPLADNGNPTQTMALLPGSAAIGIANGPICKSADVGGVDQRGLLRPAACDAGAFQTGAMPAIPILSTVSHFSGYDLVFYSSSVGCPISRKVNQHAKFQVSSCGSFYVRACYAL